MTKPAPPPEQSALPEATPAVLPRSAALESTVIGETDLGAAPGTEGDSFLRRVLADDAPARLVPGQVVDEAYRIERTLGQGGMGLVFLARDLRLDRLIALKILRGATRIENLERLIREARAMAQLIHPNVVTVYDVGTIEDDVYVAMEFLDGGTVRQWQATPRTWRELVAVYAQAGQGLAAAHQAGFVHRDFKPDNILLGADGRVRVADFGLVRQVGDPGDAADLARSTANSDDLITVDGAAERARPRDSVSVTSTGTVMGTPAYMAPEQHVGALVGPAADQFAFCVALWEALHGARPFAGDTMFELSRAVRAQVLPPPPRDRVVPAHLRRALTRGLQVDPNARFPSMAALLAAIARDPSRARRRVTAAVIGAIAIGGAGAWWLTREPAATADDACAAAATAIAPTWPADRADAITVAFIATGRPYAGQAAERVCSAFDRFAADWSAARVATCRAAVTHQQSATVRRVRDRCLDGARDQFAALVDALAHADGKIVDVALVASARLPELARCDDDELLQHSPLAGAAVLPVEVVRLTQQLVAARTALDTGRFKEAQAILEPVVAALGDGDGGDPGLAASTFMLHGAVSNAVNEMAQSRTSYERAARLAAIARDDRTVTLAWISLMEILDKLGKLDEAESLRPVTEAALERSGNPPRLRAMFLSGLGRMRSNAGRFDEARAALGEARAILEADPDGGREELTGVLNRHGILAKREGKLTDARALFERSIELQVELRGREHPYTLASLSNLASVISEAGDLEAARRLQEEVLAARTRIFGADDPSNFSSHLNLGVTLQALARYGDAATHFVAAQRLAEDQPAARNKWMAAHNVGSLALDRGDADAAIAELTRALGFGAQSPGADNPELLETFVELADAHLARGDAAAALATLTRGRTTAGAKLPDGHPRLRRVEVSRATALVVSRRIEPARAAVETVIAALRAEGPLAGNTAIAALIALGRVELAARHRAEATAALREARALAVVALGDHHPRVAEIAALLERSQ